MSWLLSLNPDRLFFAGSFNFVITFKIVSNKPAWSRSRRPLHLAANSPQNLDLAARDACSPEEASELPKDALWALRVQKPDGQKALTEVVHEPVDQILRRGFRGVRAGGFLRAMDRGDQNRNRLGKIEHREVGFCRHSNHEIAPIDILPLETTGLVAEDKGHTVETAFDKIPHSLVRRQHREVPPTAAGCRSSQRVVVRRRFLEASPPAAIDTIFCAARPTTHLRIVRFDCRSHEFNTFDAEIRGDPEGRTDIPGQRRFNEYEATHRHRSIS